VTDALWRSFDAIGFDLDGVIYRGPEPVPGAPEAISAMQRGGARIGFVTNNAYRPPSAIVDQLRGFGIECRPQDVVTSAQATARLMGDALPAAAEVLIIGSPALADEVAVVGLTPTRRRSAATAAIVVGFDPSLTWDDFNEGCYAVQNGAVYFATNDDLTRPTDQGISIGMGGMLSAIAKPLPDVKPIMGGKPARPLLDETRRRLGAKRPLFVGDRLDTDVEGAFNAGWASLFVLTGGHGPADLVAAPAPQRPTFLTADVAGLLEPPRVAVSTSSADDAIRCGAAVARADADLSVTVDGPLDTAAQRLDALWAVAHVAWQRADHGTVAQTDAVLRRLATE